MTAQLSTWGRPSWLRLTMDFHRHSWFGSAKNGWDFEGVQTTRQRNPRAAGSLTDVSVTNSVVPEGGPSWDAEEARARASGRGAEVTW